VFAIALTRDPLEEWADSDDTCMVRRLVRTTEASDRFAGAGINLALLTLNDVPNLECPAIRQQEAAMDEALKDRLTSRDLWMRALFMILFVIAYSIAEILITVTVIVQFLIILFTGSANELLIRFGNNLSTYVYQIIRFETFNTEERPFPFMDWPDEPLGENRWLPDPDPGTPAEPAVEPAPEDAPDAPDAATSTATAPTDPAADADSDKPEQDRS
jgi:hypothetical protein